MAIVKDERAAITELSLVLAAVSWGLNFAATKHDFTDRSEIRQKAEQAVAELGG